MSFFFSVFVVVVFRGDSSWILRFSSSNTAGKTVCRVRVKVTSPSLVFVVFTYLSFKPATGACPLISGSNRFLVLPSVKKRKMSAKHVAWRRHKQRFVVRHPLNPGPRPSLACLGFVWFSVCFVCWEGGYSLFPFPFSFFLSFFIKILFTLVISD